MRLYKIIIGIFIVCIPAATFAQAEGNDIRDIKGLEHFSYSLLYYIIPALLLIALAYLGWRLYQKRRGRLKVETIPPPPPDVMALKELAELRHNGQYEKLGEKLFNFRLSEIFRKYLEGRYGFPASDMTTEEILSFLVRKPDFVPGLQDKIKNILVQTDKVKFAKFRPGRNVAYGLVDTAKLFVQETRPLEVEEETPRAEKQTGGER